MRRSRHPLAAAWIAAFAATAFVLQALLLGLTPPGASAAIENLSASLLCAGSGERGDGPAAPAPLHRHSDHDCCILCAVPGLAAGGAVIAMADPGWDAPLAAPLAAARARALVTPVERAPIQARAPPA